MQKTLTRVEACVPVAMQALAGAPVSVMVWATPCWKAPSVRWRQRLQADAPVAPQPIVNVEHSLSDVHGVGRHAPPPLTHVLGSLLQEFPSCVPPMQTPLKAVGVEPLAEPQKPQKTLWPAARFAAVFVWVPVERLKGIGRLPMKGAGGGQSWLVGYETPLRL